MKTARFKQVVEACGRPQVHLSWTKPDRDDVLMKAVKAHRVMTVHQSLRGSAKDFGTVGMLKDDTAQLLLFPKSLRRFNDRRIVGIDYALLVPEKLAPFPKPSPKPAVIKKASPEPTARVRAEIVAFAEPMLPAEPPPLPPPPKPPLPDDVAKEIRQALKELKAAKPRRLANGLMH